MATSLLIIGNPGNGHMGSFFSESAEKLNLEHRVVDTRKAYQGPKLLTKIWWHLIKHKPFRLAEFSQEVLEKAKATHPTILLASGICPITSTVLKEIGKMGIRRLVFLTDDPWSPNHLSSWFLRAVRYYDTVFNPRRVNMDELRSSGCLDVRWLPFAYSPLLHYPQQIETQEDRKRFSCDVALIASADRIRAGVADVLLRSGLDLKVYGGSWERFFPGLGSRFGGLVIGPDFRKAVAGAKVHVCPVRYSNRDGHMMRTFELPACGACVIMEDTPEHRELFGNEGEVVLYYRNGEEAAEKAHKVIVTPGESERLRQAAREWVMSGAHTYHDRLLTMLE